MGIICFCFDDSLGSQPVKTAVMTDNEVCDTMVENMLFHSFVKRGEQQLIRLSVADKQEPIVSLLSD